MLQIVHLFNSIFFYILYKTHVLKLISILEFGHYVFSSYLHLFEYRFFKFSTYNQMWLKEKKKKVINIQIENDINKKINS